METDFIYWKHNTPAGIIVEEISGGYGKSFNVWREMALQVFGENGKEKYREIAHYDSGAPLLVDEPQRISISHTQGLLCVAMLPKTPEADLSVFSPRTAAGIDCERADREQASKLRERFLSETELQLAALEDTERNVQLWTLKEALYKAALTPGLDFRTQIRIHSVPEIDDNPVAFTKEACIPAVFGKATIVFPDASEAEMMLYSYRSDDYIVSLAFSPKCTKTPLRKNR